MSETVRELIDSCESVAIAEATPRTEIETIGIACKPGAPRARPLAEELAAWVEERARRAQICTTRNISSTLPLEEIDLLIAMGGDGSILRAAEAAAPYGIPVLGVNLGRVGFLTEVEPEGWEEVLSRVLDGDYWLEERMMLGGAAYRGSEMLGQADALNDVIVGRGARARVVQLRAEVDGGHLADYVADGLIVATPTGSTAYALAAGGPVLPPELRNILLVPVAPHLSMARPIVLSRGVTVRITVTGGRPAVLTVDGSVVAELEDGDQVVAQVSPHVAHFARVQERTYFYKSLLERLMPRTQCIVPDSEPEA